MIDIETIMLKIAELAKIWIPYYCWQMNLEHGDNLLGQLEVLTTNDETPLRTSDGQFITISGDPDENDCYINTYNIWSMNDYPMYKV